MSKRLNDIIRSVPRRTLERHRPKPGTERNMFRAPTIRDPGPRYNNAISRRYRDLYSMMIADLGGRDNMSTAQTALVQRIAGLTVLAEQHEERLLGDGYLTKDATEEYTNIFRTLSVGIRLIGVARKARDISPAHELDAYLKHRARKG